MLAPLVNIDCQVGLGLNLFEHLLDRILGQLEVDRRQIHLQVLYSPDNRPEPTIFDTGDRLHDSQIVARVDIFWNRGL